MKKKKAIKIAAASAVAASSFVAVAPFSTEAASNVSSAVNKAVKDAKNAQLYYINASRKGTVVTSVNTKKRVDAANKSIKAAENLVKKEKNSKKKAAYNKKLKTAKTNVARANGYIASKNAATYLLRDAEKLEAAVKKGDFENLDLDGFAKDLKKAQQTVAKTYGASARKALNSKYMEPSEAIYKDAKAKYTEYLEQVKSVNEVKAVEVNEGITKEELKAALPETVDVTLNNGKEAKKAVEWDLDAVDLSKPDTYKVTGKVADTDLPASVEVEVKSVAPAVESVSAINATQAEVKFNKELDSVVPANFKVTNAKGDTVFVSKVELNDDKRTVTLSFVDKFTVDSLYTVSVTGIKDVDGNEAEAQTASFKYEKAAVESVTFTQTTVAPESDLKEAVKVTDALGRDVSKEHTITFESANTGIVGVDGRVADDADGKSVIVVATVRDGENVVKSARTTITVSKAAPEKFVGSYVYTGSAAIDTKTFEELKAEDKVNFVYENDKDGSAKRLAVYYVDQYGNKNLNAVTDFNKNNAPTLTNLTPTVVIVDNEGVIKPISVGEGYVRVKQGNIEQTIKIEVKKAPSISTIELEKSDVSVVAGKAAGTVDVTFKDQYGNKVSAPGNDKVTVAPIDNTIATATYAPGKVTINGAKEGQTAVKVTYKDGDTTIEKTINVSVVKAGELAEYKAEAGSLKLDAGTVGPNADDKKAPNSTTVTVYDVDTNGNKLGITSGIVTLEEVGADGKALAEDKKLLSVDSVNKKVTAKEGKSGKAYVQVKVGTLVVDTIEFDVVNTAPTATSVSFDRYDILNTVEVPETGTLGQPIDIKTELTEIINVKDQNGEDLAGADPQISFTTTNVQNLKLNDSKVTDVTAASGTVDVVITKITNNSETTNLIKSPVVVKFTVKSKDPQTGKATIGGVTERAASTEKDEQNNPKYPNDKGGVIVNTLALPDGIKVSELSSLEVTLYNGNTKLVTNTFAFDRADQDVLNGSSIASVPFNYGSAGVNQWSWNRGAYPVELEGDKVKNSSKPTKVVVTYVKDGRTYSIEKSVNLGQ